MAVTGTAAAAQSSSTLISAADQRAQRDGHDRHDQRGHASRTSHRYTPAPASGSPAARSLADLAGGRDLQCRARDHQDDERREQRGQRPVARGAQHPGEDDREDQREHVGRDHRHPQPGCPPGVRGPQTAQERAEVGQPSARGHRHAHRARVAPTAAGRRSLSRRLCRGTLRDAARSSLSRCRGAKHYPRPQWMNERSPSACSPTTRPRSKACRAPPASSRAGSRPATWR